MPIQCGVADDCRYEHRHACDHDTKCVICKTPIPADRRDHFGGRCGWCSEVADGAHEVRIGLLDYEDIFEIDEWAQVATPTRYTNGSLKGGRS